MTTYEVFRFHYDKFLILGICSDLDHCVDGIFHRLLQQAKACVSSACSTALEEVHKH